MMPTMKSFTAKNVEVDLLDISEKKRKLPICVEIENLARVAKLEVSQ